MQSKKDYLYRVVVIDPTTIDPATNSPKIISQEPATDARSLERLRDWARTQNVIFASRRQPHRAEVRTAGKAMNLKGMTLDA